MAESKDVMVTAGAFWSRIQVDDDPAEPNGMAALEDRWRAIKAHVKAGQLIGGEMTPITVCDLSGLGVCATEAQADAVTKLAAAREDGGTVIPVEEIRNAIDRGCGYEVTLAVKERIEKQIVDLIENYGPVNPPPVGSIWNGVYFEGPNGVDTHIGTRGKNKAT